MKQKIAAKLRSCTGESIAETLIATLIAALALVMLAGAIGSAARIISDSNVAMNEYYAHNTSSSGWSNAINAQAFQ